MLISSLVGVDKRSTYDLDATIQGFPLTHENAEKAFREIIAVDADDDFSFEFVRTEDIREADDYLSIRVHLLAKYEKISSPLTADVTTGDKITPRGNRVQLSAYVRRPLRFAHGLSARHDSRREA